MLKARGTIERVVCFKTFNNVNITLSHLHNNIIIISDKMGMHNLCALSLGVIFLITNFNLRIYHQQIE